MKTRAAVHQCFKINIYKDFPGGPVVKNLPFNARDVELIPGPGTKIPHAVGCSQTFLKTNFKKSEMTVP